ncbi:DUF305 domain-containing protein [Sphaerisporangium krabiense]|uniref:Uncharacterized protein (DUF305 family) n=1 Tax=Sphaerisporangium krabiense TaxID=763782 RepID=A0A7W8Z7V5_9ACTN|nr:DUF305 domain-containing protein [Sphaerisporangium krabiense]MBB5629041.1 uncharacterized protein (DUF305 family) [Sphaerisporangium krabiense]
MATIRTRVILVAVITCLATVAAMLLITGRSGPPGDASAEAGFARDMAVHHAQAAEMSFAVDDKTKDTALRGLTYDIITTQTAQRGIFMGWLQQWGLTQATTRPSMAWMAGHGHAAPGTPATMPGMASDQEMKKLQAAGGKDAEILFLQLMIRHHEGGVQMARAALNLSKRPEVRTIAQSIVDTQDSEINYMTDLLQARGAKPYPSILN